MHHGIIAWIVLGAIAGLVTGKLTFGAGFGMFVDAIAGAIGGLFGGIVTRHLGLGFARKGLVAEIFYPLIGGMVLAWIVRLFSRDRRAALRSKSSSRA